MELKFDPSKVSVVDIDRVRPNTWNPKDKNTKEYATIKEGIKLKGLRLPIIVRQVNKPEYDYEIIDGEQRWTACKELEYTQIIIYNEGDVNDQQAKELTLWYEQHVPFNETALAKMVADMAQQYSGLEVPFSPEMITQMSELVKFNWNDYEKKDFDGPQGSEGKALKTLSLTMPEDQYKVIMEAISHIQKTEDGMNEARALELICANYLSIE